MIRSHRRGFLLALVAALSVIGFVGVGQAQNMMHTSKTFTGAKVNAGTVTHTKEGGKNVLKLSSDFKVPDTPDPHWQIVDSKNNVYLLQRLGVKGVTQGLANDKINMQITLPAYIKDVAKIQIYCAWTEAVLSEAMFDTTIQTN